MATKYYNKPSDPKIKWEDTPTVSDEENDILAGESVTASKKSTPKYDTNLSDAEQARRITKALVPAKKSTPKYDTNLSDAEQARRITKALVPNTEDADRQKRIDANRDYFAKKGAFKDNEGMKKGGSVKAKTKTSCYKSGGSVKSSASSRGDGCAQRGKTRGRIC